MPDEAGQDPAILLRNPDVARKIKQVPRRFEMSKTSIKEEILACWRLR